MEGPIFKKYLEMTAPMEGVGARLTYERWNKSEVQALRKYLLQFGYGRWSKIRSISKHSANCKLLHKKSDDEMRPYANMFLIHLVNCIDSSLTDKQNLTEIVTNIMTITPQDHVLAITLSSHDFSENIESRAKFWIQRINLLNKLQRLLRTYRGSQ